MILNRRAHSQTNASMKALPKRKGNPGSAERIFWTIAEASMKALPRRKGNQRAEDSCCNLDNRLNESPSQKEGKSS